MNFGNPRLRACVLMTGLACSVALTGPAAHAADTDPAGLPRAPTADALAVKPVATASDLAGELDSGPDGKPDVCLEVPVARTRIRSVRIEGDGSDAWHTPFNGSNWDIKFQSTEGDAATRLQFAPSQPTAGYRVTLLLDDESSVSGVAQIALGREALPGTGAGLKVAGRFPGKPSVSKDATKPYHLQPGDVVLFIGNSITDRAQAELDFLVEDFRGRYPELADTVNLQKFGVGGEPASEAVRRMKGLLEEFKPTVCVICYGTCEMTFEEQSGYPAALTDIVRQLKEGKARVTVVAPPPVSAANWRQPPAFVAEKFTRGLRVLADQARQVAEREGAVFVDAYGALSEAADAGMEFTVDGVHLNEDGYRVMANALQAAWGFGAPLRPAGGSRTQP
ncbi:MAG: SGNH/GDSL hydrolase family protein [Planctomycetia bacterium]